MRREISGLSAALFLLGCLYASGCGKLPADSMASSAAEDRIASTEQSQETGIESSAGEASAPERDPQRVEILSDLDGDGEQEQIVFCAIYGERPYVKVREAVWQVEEINEGSYFFPSIDVKDVDGDGRAEVIAAADTGACGGYGGIVLHILKWQDGELTELPLPTMGIGQGCELEGEFLSSEKVRFYFPATDSEQIMDIKTEKYFLQKEDAWKRLSPVADPIYDYCLYVGPDESRGIILKQYISGDCHVDGLAVLWSRVEWVEGEMQVTHQECREIIN